MYLAGCWKLQRQQAKQHRYADKFKAIKITNKEQNKRPKNNEQENKETN